LLQGVLLLHNDHPSSVAHTKESLQELKFKALDHPPYSADLIPSDFHLFGPLKEALRGCRFADDDEVKEAVHDWLCTQPKRFSYGIRKLADCWTKCIEKQGDYEEKW
jgi:histone-lysine N-methyltransferase SETMAR